MMNFWIIPVKIELILQEFHASSYSWKTISEFDTSIKVKLTALQVENNFQLRLVNLLSRLEIE